MQMVNYFKNFLYYLENQGKYSVQHFEKVIFPIFQKTKTNIVTPKSKHLQLSWTLLKVKKKGYEIVLCKNFMVMFVPHNLTTKFQPLDIFVKKATKSFLSEKYNTWIANAVLNQHFVDYTCVMLELLSNLESLNHCMQIGFSSCAHICKRNKKIINGLKYTEITGAIQSAGLFLERIENPFETQQQKPLQTILELKEILKERVI